MSQKREPLVRRVSETILENPAMWAVTVLCVALIVIGVFSTVSSTSEKGARDGVVSTLESEYGVVLSPSAVTDLGIPVETPRGEVAYGSTDILHDGELTTVTLVYRDGAYRLLTADGTELVR